MYLHTCIFPEVAWLISDLRQCSLILSTHIQLYWMEMHPANDSTNCSICVNEPTKIYVKIHTLCSPSPILALPWSCWFKFHHIQIRQQLWKIIHCKCSLNTLTMWNHTKIISTPCSSVGSISCTPEGFQGFGWVWRTCGPLSGIEKTYCPQKLMPRNW